MLVLSLVALDYVDYILLNEGVYALIDLLSSDFKNLEKIEGIGLKIKKMNFLSKTAKIVKQEDLDNDIPGMLGIYFLIKKNH